MDYIVFAVAVLPIVVLMYFMYKKDSLQPEPKEQLQKAFYLGVLSLLLSFLISVPLNKMGVFPDEVTSVFDTFRLSFFGAAIPEELAKFAVLWFFLRNNTYFDEKFDGILYAACVSMGFAALENILYLYDNIDNFVTVGTIRAVFAVPGHLCFGIMMGYYYSLVRFYPNSKRHNVNRVMVLFVPILLHGLYDMMLFAVQVLNPLLVIIMVSTFLFFCIRMWKYAARRIDEHLARDMNSGTEEQRHKSMEEFRKLAIENPRMFEPELAEVLYDMGKYYQENNRASEAEAMYSEAVPLYKHADQTLHHCYKAEIVKALHAKGIISFYGLGNYDESVGALTEAIQVCYSMDSNKTNDFLLASVFLDLAKIHVSAEHGSKAKDYSGYALDIYRKHSNTKGVADSMTGLIKACLSMKRYGEARRWADDLIRTCKEHVSRDNSYYVTLFDAMMLKAEGFYSESIFSECEVAYQEMWSLFSEQEHKHSGKYTKYLAIIKMRLGILYFGMGDNARSYDALRESLSYLDAIKTCAGVVLDACSVEEEYAIVTEFLTKVCCNMGKNAEAEQYSRDKNIEATEDGAI